MANNTVLTKEQVTQGGNTTKKRYGREHFVRIAKIRAANMKKDPDYFKRLSAAGIAARKKKKELAQKQG